MSPILHLIWSGKSSKEALLFHTISFKWYLGFYWVFYLIMNVCGLKIKQY